MRYDSKAEWGLRSLNPAFKRFQVLPDRPVQVPRPGVVMVAPVARGRGPLDPAALLAALAVEASRECQARVFRE